MNHVLKLKTLADLYKNDCQERCVRKRECWGNPLSARVAPNKCYSVDSLVCASKAQNLEIKVEVTTLDKVISGLKESSVDILKIDVQGFEVGVLKGARRALNKVKVVMIEVSLYDFYGNSKSTWFDVNKILEESNFKLIDAAKVSKNSKNLRTNWVELIFIRSK